MLGEKDKMKVSGGDQQITRKEAIQKAGRYAAFTAAAMMLILEPVRSQPPKSPPDPPKSGKIPKKTKKPGTPPVY
jgi:hypothetical protein